MKQTTKPLPPQDEAFMNKIIIDPSDMWDENFKPQKDVDFILNGSWKSKWSRIAVERIKAVNDVLTKLRKE